jgi:hypothetical protein
MSRVLELINRARLFRSAVEVIGMIELAPLAHTLTGVGLSLQRLLVGAFGLHRGHERGLGPGREGWGAATGMARLTFKCRLRLPRLPRLPRGLPGRLRLGRGGFGVCDLTGQVQAGGLDHLLLDMEQIR